MKKRIVTLTCLAAIAATAALTYGSGGALSRGFGKTLGEWQKLYFTWFLGGDQSNPEGHVVFMPIPDGVPQEAPDGTVFFVGHADVTLADNQAFMLPVWTYVGEAYLQDIPDDAPLPEEVFTGADVLVLLDGKPLLDSTKDDLSKFYTDAVYFDQPIVYDNPQPRGDGIDAVAALWVQGVGLLRGPLKVGEHTLSLYVDTGFGFGFINTWDIVVVSDE